MSYELFNKNITILKKYKYYFGLPLMLKKYSEITYNDNDSTIIIADDVKKNDRILFFNEMSYFKIKSIEKSSYMNFFYKWKRTPLYLFYEENEFEKILGYFNIEELITTGRVVFIVGWNYLKNYFNNMQTVLPDKFFNDGEGLVKNIINNQKRYRKELLEKTHRNIASYYSQNEQQIIENIQNSKYKILFITTRFLGYRYLRDLYEGSVRAGYDTELAIEDDNINRIYYELYIDKYKPDIIFMLNQFRHNFKYIPKQPVCITWIVDRYDYIYSKDASSRLGKRDIICNALINDSRLWEQYGYDKNALIELLYPGNDMIYQKYSLTAEEKNKFSCDIALVSNNTDYKGFLHEIIDQIPEMYKDTFIKLSNKYYEQEYNENSIYGHKNLKEYISKQYEQDNIYIPDDVFEIIFNYFLLARYFARKHVWTRWLIEEGNYKIKLWGLDWCKMPEFQKYDMGVAPNGETLSKIYQSAKICIAAQPDVTYPSRVPEITLSGSMPIISYIPPEYDIVPCKYLELDKDIICFYNKQDLYDKLKFYLNNEQERKKMISRTKKAIQQNLIVEKQAKFVFDEIEKRFMKREDL